MNRSSLATLAGCGGTLILSGSAQAAFTGVKAVLKPNPYVALTWNIYATFDQRPGDFVFAVAGTPLAPLDISVRGGTYYQHPLGGDLPPMADLFAEFPSLAFDTFVTIGTKTGVAPGTITVFPGFSFGPDSLMIENGGWFVPPDSPLGSPNANGQVLLAQLSTQDGVGFFGTILVSGFSNGVSFQQVVSFDTQQGPAPGALGLIGVAGLLGSRRRRRRP